MGRDRDPRIPAPDADDERFDNDVVCPALYAWVKGDGPEPYSPVVASLTVLVCDLIDRDRKRRVPQRDPAWDRLDELARQAVAVSDKIDASLTSQVADLRAVLVDARNVLRWYAGQASRRAS